MTSHTSSVEDGATSHEQGRRRRYLAPTASRTSLPRTNRTEGVAIGRGPLTHWQ